jgi:hypothetical protein
MALVRSVKWQYFCGANVTVHMDNVLIGEAVAIGYNLSQNRTPLYGYNSPHFNAVSDGQVIVQGKIALNYVSHEYLLAAMRSNGNLEIPITDSELDQATLENDSGYSSSTDAIATLKNIFWGNKAADVSEYNTDITNRWGRPDQHSRSVDIRVIFGDMMAGNTTHILKHVFFTGRSMETIITDDPSVETFDFIARSVI